MFYILCILSVSVHLSFLHFDIDSLTALTLWQSFHNVAQFFVFFSLDACYHVLTFLLPPSLLPPILRPRCVSLINLYHSMVNCLTFTSCVWGARSGVWNGSVVSQGQIHPSRFLRFIFFFPCHPFTWLSFTGYPWWKGGIRAKRAGERRDKKHPSLAKRNRKPPSTCLRKRNQSRLWDEPKMSLRPHILHLWPIGNVNPPGVGCKKALTVPR